MSRRRGDDRGQATLELIAMLPVVLLLTGLLLQVGAIAWAITDTTEAARQGARASSMGQDGCSAAEAALSGSLTIVPSSCSAGGGTVALQVRAPILVPGFDDVRISRSAEMPDVTER
ncbi:TadE/TadG family type IV pilus assembly protein [Jannaschia sp. R86511]|uniref:TadE/TadG family type IV pilus assembly protein n=1 Tax=Jannaschia sp. R86511 TaxID=3093853 RepID=UPI0036D2F698